MRPIVANRTEFSEPAPLRRKLRRAATVATVLITGGALNGHAQPPAPKAALSLDSSFVTDKIIVEGRSLFRGQGGCFVCHGQNLKGLVGPTLLAHQWKDAKDGTLAEIYRVIMKGVPNTVMVARPNGISDAQAKRIASYVWAASLGKTAP